MKQKYTVYLEKREKNEDEKCNKIKIEDESPVLTIKKR